MAGIFERCASVSAMLFVAGFALPAGAADLPESTRKMLAELKVDAGILGDIDKALTVPKAWLDAAVKEDPAVIGGTWEPKDFELLSRPFRERFPGVKLKYFRASRYDRVIKPLIALKAGRVVTDVISGLGGQLDAFTKLDALADLRDLPAWQGLSPDVRDPDGLWAGQRLIHYCLGYNTTKVKAEDLPHDWDDLLKGTRWHAGRLALINRPDNWLLNLWWLRGEAWARNFTTKLFNEVKPQLRKESTNASLSLAVAGEFEAFIYASPRRVRQFMDRKAPAGCHFLATTPVSISQMVVIKPSPRIHGARIFTNWLISREGQIAHFLESKDSPIYEDMQDRGLTPVPMPPRSKVKYLYEKEEMAVKHGAALTALWDDLWFGRQGIKVVKVKTRIESVKRGGREVSFKADDGKTHSAKLSSSRTEVVIDGDPGDRSMIKAGMACQIMYSGSGQDALKVLCDK